MGQYHNHHSPWLPPCLHFFVDEIALLGAQISDHVFLLMTDDAVEMMFSNNGNIQLGADIGVAVGPLGRALEADIGASPGKLAPIYTYSLSKGLYAGVSLDGKVIMTRHRVNERFYGREVSGMELLGGQIPTPPAARPLYDALQRCHVYATGHIPNRRNLALGTMPENQSLHQFGEWDGFGRGGGAIRAYPQTADMEYGELPEPIALYPPAANDQHSYAGMSDVTSDPGY
jgi:Las17-binding protein actin regulator